jgi:hypothetical protein
MLSKSERRDAMKRVTEQLEVFFDKDDLVDETDTRLEYDKGTGTNWTACFELGLITVECGDVRCELALDDEDWKPIARRMLLGLYWAMGSE